MVSWLIWYSCCSSHGCHVIEYQPLTCHKVPGAIPPGTLVVNSMAPGPDPDPQAVDFPVDAFTALARCRGGELRSYDAGAATRLGVPWWRSCCRHRVLSHEDQPRFMCSCKLLADAWETKTKVASTHMQFIYNHIYIYTTTLYFAQQSHDGACGT